MADIRALRMIGLFMGLATLFISSMAALAVNAHNDRAPAVIAAKD
jgi:hypothetical protein